MWPFREKPAAGSRRTAAQVAARCVCVEMVIERIALEQACEAGQMKLDELEATRTNLLEVVTFLGLDDELTKDERAALERKGGTLDDSEELSIVFADLPYLLWMLGRIPRLFSVADLEAQLPEIIERGLFRTGDRHDIKKAMDRATLRPAEEIDAQLDDIAKANGLAIGARGEASRTVPPGSVFYVLPWSRNSEWPWGEPCRVEAELELEGKKVRVQLGLDGIKVL